MPHMGTALSSRPSETRGLARPRRRRPIVSLTPLIDVVFILLVFFMLASSFLDWRALDLATPSGAASGASVEGAVLVRVPAEGTVDIGGRPVEDEAIAAEIAGLLGEDAARRVIVAAGTGLALQRLVSVVDAVTAGGAANVALSRSGAAP